MNLEEQNLKNLCHFCLIKSKRLKSIYEKTFQVSEKTGNYNLCVVDFISLITNVKMQDENEFPKFVCAKCSKQIDNFMKFRLNCIKSFEHLHNIQVGINCSEAIESIKCEVQLLENSNDFNTNIETLKINKRSSLSRSTKNKAQVATCEVEIKAESNEDSDQSTNFEDDTLANAGANISGNSDDLNNTEKSDNNDDEGWEPSTIVKTKKKRQPKHSRKKKCNASESDTNEDEDNLKNKQKSKKPPQKTCESMICMICGGSFKNMSVHIKTHSDERPFACDLCGWRFREKGNLESHVKTVHLNLRPNKCDKCGKGFNTKRNLNLHILSHSTERNFKCEICDLTFKLPTTLRKHKATHIQNRRYECTECGKTFLTKTQHKQHTWIHTGEKPHPCKICDKRFRTAGERRVHELHVHRDIFKSEPKRFRITSNLINPEIISAAQQN